MKKYFNCAIMSIVLLIAVTFPAHAVIAPTKTALVQMISEQTKGTKVNHTDAVRIVNASFIEGKKRDIDPFLIISLIKAESRFRPLAVSSEGARGLMQVIPRWHHDKIRGRNINHIETNIEVGTQVLADCLASQKGHIKKALRCYSSGAVGYTAKLKTGYLQARQADLIYRFKNNLPLVVSGTFEEPKNFSISHNPPPLLASVKRRAEEQILLASLGH